MIIPFKYTTKYGIFSDALNLEDDHNLSDNEIEAMKQERLENWIAHIETPVEIPVEQVEIPVEQVIESEEV